MPWLVETGYSHAPNNRTTGSAEALPTCTTRQTVGLAGFISKQYGGAADPKFMSFPLSNPLGTVTTSDHHALISADAFLTYYYGSAEKASTVTDPLNTVTVRDRVGLAQSLESMTIDDLTFRMLQPNEIGKAMAFPKDYVVKGTSRERVKQYGNAVTPPVMQMIMERVIETFS